MKRILATILFFCIGVFEVQTTAFAGQTTQTKNSVYLEIGGSGGAYSLNYGKTFFNIEKWQLRAHIGFSVMSVMLYDSYRVYPVFPFGLNALYGSGRHYLKLGLANTLYLGYQYQNPAQSEYENGVQIHKPKYNSKLHDSIFPLIGYHYQFNSKYFAHIVFSPLIYDNGFSFFPWGGIGLGMNF